MVEKEQEWILPDNLRRQEAEARATMDAGGRGGGGHCGAYYAYRLGTDTKAVEAHGVIDDDYAKAYVENVAALLGSVGLDLRGAVLDAGCGIGTVTSALARVNPDGETLGMEIAADAVAVARAAYPALTFHESSADELHAIPDVSLDVVHAREFYPFTRSSDADYHMHFFDAFQPKLKQGGLVVAQSITVPRGLCHTFSGLRARLAAAGYDRAWKNILVPTRLFRRLGPSLYWAPVYGMLVLALRILDTVAPGRVNWLFILRKAGRIDS